MSSYSQIGFLDPAGQFPGKHLILHGCSTLSFCRLQHNDMLKGLLCSWPTEYLSGQKCPRRPQQDPRIALRHPQIHSDPLQWCTVCRESPRFPCPHNHCQWRSRGTRTSQEPGSQAALQPVKYFQCAGHLMQCGLLVYSVLKSVVVPLIRPQPASRTTTPSSEISTLLAFSWSIQDPPFP